MQLSLFKIIPEHTTSGEIYTFNLNTPNPKQAAKLQELATSMQQSIDNKLNPAINKQRATKRRKTIAQSIIAEGVELQTIQSWLPRASSNGTGMYVKPEKLTITRL